MAHRTHHPQPVPGCFGCKVAGIGWQGRMSAAHDRTQVRQGIKPDPTQAHPVVADDGPRRGRVVGHHTEHWEGQQDATVKAPLVRHRLVSEEA